MHHAARGLLICKISVKHAMILSAKLCFKDFSVSRFLFR